MRINNDLLEVLEKGDVMDWSIQGNLFNEFNFLITIRNGNEYVLSQGGFNELIKLKGSLQEEGIL